jgi:hypothetical protein
MADDGLFKGNLLSGIILQKKNSGDHSEGETPDPIPNSAVKPFRANGTTRVTVWESRASPGIF